MAGRLSRRRLLGTMAAITTTAGCTDSTSGECEEGIAYSYRVETYQVEPVESGWGSDGDPTDADPNLVDDLQREVPLGVRVSIDRELTDEDDYVFSGAITRKEALRACDRAGIEVNDTDRSRAITSDLIETLERRLETIRANGVPLEHVELTEIEDFEYLLYDEDVPEATRETWNRRLGTMGAIDVLVGDPNPGRWRPVRPTRSAIEIDGTTLTVPIADGAVHSLFRRWKATNDDAEAPMRVYLDGNHVATRTLSSADFEDETLLDPETTVAFDSRERAVGAYAALVHPTSSVVSFVTQCD